MSMTKRLWSINGLAGELGYDRRTIGKRLAEVQPDGDIAGHPAWFLDTALAVLNPRKEAPRPSADLLLETVVGRLQDWREIYIDNRQDGEEPGAVSIAAMARCCKVEPADVLVWLRAGCPYLKEGDWETGEGFVLRYSWASEWTMLMLTRTIASSDWKARNALRLSGGVFAG